MATNFGTKIAINAFLREITRYAITYNRGFSWLINPKKTFPIASLQGKDVAMETKFWPK